MDGFELAGCTKSESRSVGTGSERAVQCRWVRDSDGRLVALWQQVSHTDTRIGRHGDATVTVAASAVHPVPASATLRSPGRRHAAVFEVAMLALAGLVVAHAALAPWISTVAGYDNWFAHPM